MSLLMQQYKNDAIENKKARDLQALKALELEN